MDELIIKEAKKVLKTDDVKIKFRLLGGMSNYTYVIESNNTLYTIRLLGEYAEKFVNRDDEIKGIALFSKLGITNETIYFDKESGLKLAKYVSGSPLSETTIDYELVSNLMKKYHNSGLTTDTYYNPFSRLEWYENNLVELGFRIPSDYFKAKDMLLKYKPYLDSQERVLCHNDSQPSNFIKTEDGKLLIVDFEFFGMNDLIYDIACFGNSGMEHAVNLLKVYYDNPDNDKWMRLYLWRSFQCFQWYNVAYFKELVGMSASLKLDFKMIALNYLKLAIEFINIAKKYE